MNGTKSAKEYRKGEQLEITEEKMTEETLEKIEEIFQEFLEGRNENSKKIADSKHESRNHKRIVVSGKITG